MASTAQKLADRYPAVGRQCTAIILADVEWYGGEDFLPARWGWTERLE